MTRMGFLKSKNHIFAITRVCLDRFSKFFHPIKASDNCYLTTYNRTILSASVISWKRQERENIWKFHFPRF